MQLLILQLSSLETLNKLFDISQPHDCHIGQRLDLPHYGFCNIKNQYKKINTSKINMRKIFKTVAGKNVSDSWD